MAAASSAETAVREYLLFLENPEQLVDTQRVEELNERVQNAVDPVERLIALAEYERARHPIEDTYRQTFIDYAKDWADENEISASAFEQVGVSKEVLREAGLIADGSVTRRLSKAARSGTSPTTVDQLKSAIPSMRGPFTAKDLAEAAGGGSPMTIRKALTEATDDGTIRRLGPVPNWTARGRAPIQYERI